VPRLQTKIRLMAVPPPMPEAQLGDASVSEDICRAMNGDCINCPGPCDYLPSDECKRLARESLKLNEDDRRKLADIIAKSVGRFTVDEYDYSGMGEDE
jgi:hypothetical protein